MKLSLQKLRKKFHLLVEDNCRKLRKCFKAYCNIFLFIFTLIQIRRLGQVAKQFDGEEDHS